MNSEPFRDLRKHINDMTSYEIQVIRNAIVVAKNNSRIRVPNHLKDRLRQKYITMDDVANTIERGHIIEAHIIDYSFRVLLRLHKEGTNKDVCVVVELVDNVIVTTFTNQSADTHKTLREELYDKDLDVVELLSECKRNKR